MERNSVFNLDKNIRDCSQEVIREIENSQFNKIAKSVVRFDDDDRYIVTYQMLCNILKANASMVPKISERALCSIMNEEDAKRLSRKSVFNSKHTASYKQKCIDKVIAANINSVDFDSINDLLSIINSLDGEEANNTLMGVDNDLKNNDDFTIMDRMIVLKANVLRNIKAKQLVK